MKTFDNEVVIAILFGSLMLALIGAFMFVMVIFYQRRKIRYIKEQQRMAAQYEHSVLRAKMEMREETLRYVGQELHDNVGQVLSLIKLYLSRPQVSRTFDVEPLIDQAIQDIRSLSRDLNIGRAEQYTLSKFIEQALNKVQKTGLMKITFQNEGFCELPDAHKRLMICRIFQECMNNVLKHAEAGHLRVELKTENGTCVLSIADDGVGFDTRAANDGAGLANIHDRINLIGGEIQIISSPGKGTNVILRIPQ